MVVGCCVGSMIGNTGKEMGWRR